MKKIISIVRKVIVGVILAVLLVIVFIPMAVFLSFSSKERRDRFVDWGRKLVLDVMIYLNED